MCKKWDYWIASALLSPEKWIKIETKCQIVVDAYYCRISQSFLLRNGRIITSNPLRAHNDEIKSNKKILNLILSFSAPSQLLSILIFLRLIFYSNEQWISVLLLLVFFSSSYSLCSVDVVVDDQLRLLLLLLAFLHGRFNASTVVGRSRNDSSKSAPIKKETSLRNCSSRGEKREEILFSSPQFRLNHFLWRQ